MVSESSCLKLLTSAGAVLILVLVEDGLGAFIAIPKEHKSQRLNPCFSGGWSRSSHIYYYIKTWELDCLNPCFSGGWSRSVLTVLDNEQLNAGS